MTSDPSPLWHPFTQHALSAPEIAVASTQGAYLYTPDGRKILDGISSWWVVTHGHNHPKIVAAVQEQLGKMDQVIFAGFTHEPAEQLAQTLIKCTGKSLGPGLSQVFLSDSGSTAVEVALKMAIGYWHNKGQKRRKILALEGAYHGDTFGAMAAGSRGVFSKAYEDFLFDVQHIPFPAPGHESQALETFERILKTDSDDIAAFIFEPLIQGASGMRMYSAGTLKVMMSLCRNHDVPTIADEVMTGFGRTGTMFACEQAGLLPDIMALSKGLTGGFLPMGATLCTREIYDAFYHKDRSKMFFHSTSFTGNPLACAAANAAIQIFEDEPVLERVHAIETAHKESAEKFFAHERVQNVRAMGAVLALDLKVPEQGYLSGIGPLLYDSALSRDVLLRPLGNTVYSLPPYCVTPEDLDKIYDIISFALDRVGHDGRQQAA